MAQALPESTQAARSRFAEWRYRRPFWGGLTLTLSGLVIGIIPLDLALKFGIVPHEFAIFAMVFAIVVLLCGLFTLAQPQFASFFGAIGILTSIASMFGALGGFGIGTFLGILGGSLVIAWEGHRETEDADESDSGPSFPISLLPPSIAERFTD